MQPAMMKGAPIIEQANPYDIAAILRVQETAVIDDLTAADPKRGFFIHRLPAGTFLDAIADERHALYAARRGSDLVGYALALNFGAWRASEPAAVLRFDDPAYESRLDAALLLRQVALLPGEAKVVTQLEDAVVSHAKSCGYRFVLGQMMHEPLRNRRSIMYHVARGMAPIGEEELTEEFLDGGEKKKVVFRWGIYSATL